MAISKSLYEFNAREQRFLAELGRSNYGVELMDLLRILARHAGDVSQIDRAANIEAQVVGRDLTKQYLLELVEAIRPKKKPGGQVVPTDEIDEFA